MTSPPDDDPEYEAQLNEVLGTAPTWQGPGDGLPENAEEGEAGAVGKGAHNRSEDGVLAGATSFRTKGLRQERGEQVQNDDEQLEVSLAGEDRALSEDARSISTGDDSPSAQVFPQQSQSSTRAEFACRAAKSFFPPLQRQAKPTATAPSPPPARSLPPEDSTSVPPTSVFPRTLPSQHSGVPPRPRCIAACPPSP